MITFEGTLRVSTFLLHFTSALFLLGISFRCGGAFVSRSYLDTATNTLGFPVIMESPCADPHARECFFAMPQSYATLQRGFEWNPLALLAAFEWLSASFALYYLKDTVWVHSNAFRRVVDSVCLLWNVAGIGLFLPFSLPLTLFQSSLSVLALGASSVVQALENVRVGLEMDPSRVEAENEAKVEAEVEAEVEADDEQRRAVFGPTHQPENRRARAGHERVYFYPPMAEPPRVPPQGQGRPLIYRRGSQQWVVPSVPDRDGSAAKPTTALASANALVELSQSRVTLHYTEYCTSASLLLVAVLILFVADPFTWAQLIALTGILLCNLTGIAAHCCKLDQDTRTITPWWDLDWTKEANHFKLLMLHSWSMLILSIFVVIYLGWTDLTNSAVPDWVRFILWNLLVTYSLFGFWATLCYSLAGTRTEPERFARWMSRLDYGLTVLSVAAKIPVAYTVFYGLIGRPGEGIC